MKKISIILFALFIACVSCKKEDNSNSTPVSSGPVSGTWTITYFIDNGNNETQHYTNYTFDFKSGNVVTATHNGITANGTWTQKTDDNLPKLVISFSGTD